MSNSNPTISRRALLGSTLLLAGAAPPRTQARGDTSLWDFYRGTLRRAKYIDLTPQRFTRAPFPGVTLAARRLESGLRQYARAAGLRWCA